VFAWLGLLALVASACLNLLQGADSHPVQTESGLTTVRYGDTVVAEPVPPDGGRGRDRQDRRNRQERRERE
jgi:hypothetical protein